MIVMIGDRFVRLGLSTPWFGFSARLAQPQHWRILLGRHQSTTARGRDWAIITQEASCMARLQFSIKGREVYRTTVEVRVDNINYAGHLGHDSVLTLCHEARVRFLRDIGQHELDFFGRGIIMTDAMVSYLGEGALGDRIEITLSIDEVEKSGFALYYAMRTVEKEIARVKTGLVFFDYENREVTSCPREFLRRFGPEAV